MGTMAFYTFNPFFVVKATGVSADVIYVSDYVSNLCVLRPFSAKVVQTVLKMDTYDVGNQCITALSLVFSGMRSYTVNSRTADWKIRAIFTYGSLP